MSAVGMDESSDDEPLAVMVQSPPKSKKRDRKAAKEEEADSSDDEPLAAMSQRKAANGADKKRPSPAKTAKKKKPTAVKRKAAAVEDDESSDDEPLSRMPGKAKKAVKKPATKRRKAEPKEKGKGKAPKKEEPPEEIFKWWLVPEHPDGVKWLTLEHKGPIFPPEYKPLPGHIRLRYDGSAFQLGPEAEEVAGFYAVMLDSDYTKKQTFRDNFWKSWREVMTEEERKHITSLKKCDFTQIQAHYKELSEAKKSMPKEDKLKVKEEKEKLKAIYGVATVDGQKQNVGNFTIEPPGLFRGRGEHPKMGLLKKRVAPEQVSINIGKDAEVPKPPEGHKWKAVQHDNKVTWLCGWTENVQAQNKYVMLANDSSIKGRNDWKKYETARRLKGCVGKIRKDYTEELRDKEMFKRQRATALYLIDRLALRAGGAKDSDEEADTVGCCNLRVEHVRCIDDDTVEFDFLGKDSIRYYNKVKVHKQVWKNLRIFQKPPKAGTDELFDRLTTPLLNEYLSSLMSGLTAKVFRTFNASITLQQQLANTPERGTVEEKMLAYNRANREVAVLCNHQRAPPKKHGEQMERLDDDIAKIKTEYSAAKKEFKQLRASLKKGDKKLIASKKKVDRLKVRLHKKEISKVEKQEGKTISLGTSKLNYLDPRISVGWTMKHDVPINKVYNKTQLKKFRWAQDMADANFEF